MKEMKLLKLELENKKEALLLYDKVIEVVHKFHGKKPSARLDTALKTIDKNLSFDMHYNSFVIQYNFKNRYITENNYNHYSKDTYDNLVHNCIKSCYGDGICQNDTINSVTLIKNLKTSKEYLQKSIDQLTDNLENLDSIIKEYEMIKKMKEKFNNKVSYLVRDYLNMK